MDNFSSTQRAQTIEIGALRLDLHARTLSDSQGTRIELRSQALELLCLLGEQPGEVVTKRTLIDRIWPDVVVTDDSLVQAVGDARRALGPDGHQQLQTVPRRGYRLIAQPVEPADAVDRVSAVPANALLAARDRRQRRLGLLAIGGACLAATALWLVNARGGFPTPPGLPDRPPIAVLDFADPAASDADRQIGRAWSEELASALARNVDLHVVAPSSSLDRQVGAGGDSTPSALAKRLGATYLVAGRLQHEPGRLRVQVDLLDGRSGRLVWNERHDIDAARVNAVRDALVDRIAGSVHSNVRRSQETWGLQRPPASLDVYTRTLRAMALKHRFSPEATAEADRLLDQVHEQDPFYAPAWIYHGWLIGIAADMRLLPESPVTLRERAIRMVEHGLGQDGNMAPGHAALAQLYTGAGRHVEAVSAARRCLALAPSDADCALFASYALVADGQIEEAAAQARRALQLNTVPSAYVLAFVGEALWAARDFDGARSALDDCLRQVPHMTPCRLSRMALLVESGRSEQARQDYAALAGLPRPTMVGRLRARPYGPAGESVRQRLLAAWESLDSGRRAGAVP